MRAMSGNEMHTPIMSNLLVARSKELSHETSKILKTGCEFPNAPSKYLAKSLVNRN
jgi:hypothetical protein